MTKIRATQLLTAMAMLVAVSVMMTVMMERKAVFEVTGWFGADLVGIFQLQSGMGDFVFGQRLTHPCFDGLSILVGYHVESGVIFVSIHTPNV